MITPSFALTATERVLPRLALDFTTAILDSRVTFTRTGNTATVINSSGLVAPINADLPRFDYDPTTLVCKGLLIEETRTNLIKNSSALDGVDWAAIGAVVTADQATAPDGTLTADRLTFAATTERIFQSVGVTLGVAYTVSIWLWADAGQATAVRFQITDGASAVIQEITASLTTTPTRFTVTATSTSTTIRLQLRGSQANKSLYVWGAQLEQGSFPTSYIPTEASAVTRNADVATMTGTNFSDFFNASAGTFFINTNARNADVLLTAGTYTLSANATALKKYATTYTADPSATELVFGKGTIQAVNYYKQALIAAELAALTA